jgi:pimeloyl-ACP methyl ester carboxylesterase
MGMPAFAIALMRWLPVWGKVMAVAHTLPYDGAIVREFQRGEPLPKETWAKVTIPTLAIHGAKSPPWMQKSTRALAAVLPHAQCRSLEGQTHDVDAKAVGPVLKDFFGSAGVD